VALYHSIFYGGGFYGTGSKDVPRDLHFYRTNVDNVYVFYWGFRFDFVTPLLATADFDLELDTTPTFNSPNLVQFNSGNVIDYQNGNVHKGYAVPVSIRQEKTEQIWYARVRTVIGFSASDWSTPLQFVILQKFKQETTERLIDNLPDYHVYNKQDLKRPVNERLTLLYQIMGMYGKEFDQAQLERILTQTNIYINLCRDEQLYDNFGVLFNYRKPQTQEFVEYRECLKALILGSLTGSTLNAIQAVSRCFTGVDADLLLIRDRDDFFITPVLEVPPEVPNGAITAFSTSSDYKPYSLQVLKNGLVLTPGVDFTEDHTGPVFGFNMAVAPLGGDVIQVLFDIGQVLPGDPDGDPEPIIFDITDTTPITGTTTFTNGSRVVSGVGTAYSTELQEGNLISDNSGFVFGLVKNIISNTSLELQDPWTGTTGANASTKRITFNGALHLTGDITFTNSDPNVSAIGGAFTTELAVGDSITDNDGSVAGIVQSITDDDNLVLASNWTGTSGSNINARKLTYEEAILWNKATLSHGVIIRVNNPGQFVLEEELIQTLLTPLLPAYARVFYEFV
jgi:hypothetical protein